LYDSNSNALYSQTINIPSGESRISLDWQIPQENNLKITASTYPNLFRNGSDNGPNLGYPFNINNYISITSSTAGTSATSYYYYFYDWEIEEKCESPLIPIYINVNELPIANFTYNIEGNIVSFFNYCQNANYFYWDFGDGTNSTEINPIHIYNNSNSFIVSLIASNECGLDTYTQTITITNIDDFANEIINITTIDNNLIIKSESIIENVVITNVIGQIIYEKDINSNYCFIPLQAFNQGIYLIKINNKYFYKIAK